MKSLLKITWLLWGALTFPAYAVDLPDTVRQALKKTGIPEAAVGIYVREVGAERPLVSVNADVPMNPASVMKVVTTYAGLEMLGPSYTWRTKVYANGNLENGRLQGDLIIKGYGDPSLNLENFWLLLRQLRQSGLKDISGDLVLDYSYYSFPTENPGAFDGKRYKTYNVAPEALLVNYHTSTLHLFPESQHGGVRVTADPESQLLNVQNHLKLTQKKCSTSGVRVNIRDDVPRPGHVTVMLEGDYSAHCGQTAYYLSLHESSTYIHQLFSGLWKQLDGTFNGSVRHGVTSKTLNPISVYHSPPLAEVIRGINKFSNNVAAKQLFLSLGETESNGGEFVSPNLARSGIRQWLFSKNMDFPELVLENGSGLSRIERISARHLNDLLNAAYFSPTMPEFMASLAVVGVDGTARKRLKKSVVAQKAHIKTGTLKDVSAIAGYVLNHKKKRYVIVFIVNHPKSGGARVAMDALLEWLYIKT
ncbi:MULTISPECIES: D-alanyl-D-alanine carboxypeptidase/D-alanyl-D-alanine endopeptidase [Nitrosomonas]|uniref:D-alanyl-D-alanine carboxypeptidase/D-alanyl-D-alanine-endopeptidase (Penicillin-binding protein 4) n=2 Tax=Nitrosomonas eutropha TaxID=916 RepID=A0ABX5M7U9_9PROT|nr:MULTISPECIES: D-alanyl-D-alanine carboxypeptidase/D-alanyl-D-alanine-endopeptidase [Nitrosomonas]ABI58508.1 D-Ala-D-Ala carboxypeptidase PBP3, Serine peptidase, MEROPS family S13 [Nitrosomonas eutropha C91]MXS80999.1 D-alanyl-D-alanine carboxypeptidase/D-alanyl-D-alanine-endopeptidase [Nitrosomonas sp. GH22]PXV82302.1 D-alanyl-D-alanine carboxypeptidase/D-alanyl-D-alanine-endopeptidase (penicillin-binding protein 4) [Nitrosomonas eutropha]SDW13426.1 D-alanyl-D-alanine carboxypeptidase / D-al